MRNILLIVLSVVLAGCIITPSTVSDALVVSTTDTLLFESTGTVSDVRPVKLEPLPLKDFITSGIIFVTTSVTLDTDGNIIDGSKITYEMLMKEVQKLNADDFVNLRIDEILTITTTEGVVKRMVSVSDGGESRQVEREERTIITVPSGIEYKATALAIKYLPVH